MTPTIDYRMEAETIISHLYDYHCMMHSGESFYYEDDLELHGWEGITGRAIIEGCIDCLNERTGHYETKLSVRLLDGQYVDEDENYYPIDIERINAELDKQAIDSNCNH